jgi:nucleotide-binding universal stress UspA family protein
MVRLKSGGVKMYKKVLVPLDGSERAEGVLPHVRDLAKAGAAGEIILMKIIDLPAFATEIPSREAILSGSLLPTLLTTLRDDAARYLEKIQSQLSAEGLNVRSEILEGRTIKTILDYLYENEVNLIVVATHGHSGVTQFLLGSIAHRIIHTSDIPVLLVRV